MTTYFSIIFARGNNYEFGHEGRLPWGKLPEDLDYFKQLTTNTQGDHSKKNIIIMGRLTFQSIGYRALPNRINIVVSKSMTENSTEGIIITKDFSSALEASAKLIKERKALRVFLIGGASLIENALSSPNLEYVYETIITPLKNPNFPSDKKAPIVKTDEFKLVTSSTIQSSTGDHVILFQKFSKIIIGHPETEYLKLCDMVLKKGIKKKDRTGKGTISISGGHLRIPLDRFPLYTTKNVFFRGVVEELLFFLSGKTNTKILEARGVNIWKGNTSREALDKLGLHEYEDGEMGPGYGFQMRHYGAKYVPNVQLEIGAEGFDQIKWVIENIKKVKDDPSSPLGRRLIVIMWNPMDMPKCALPCCHYSVQFTVTENLLNCIVTMRSNDIGCGNPFNVASYALLTYMICHLVNLKPGELIINMGDCHIYLNHIEGIQEQIERPPRVWPSIQIIGTHTTIDDFNINSFKLIDYNPHPVIKLEMAV
jgi:thymidylate synthase